MHIENLLSIAEAARLFGVTRSRMHQLIDTYQVNPVRIHPRLLMVSRKELNKIPKERPDGKHVSPKKN